MDGFCVDSFRRMRCDCNPVCVKSASYRDISEFGRQKTYRRTNLSGYSGLHEFTWNGIWPSSLVPSNHIRMRTCHTSVNWQVNMGVSQIDSIYNLHDLQPIELSSSPPRDSCTLPDGEASRYDPIDRPKLYSFTRFLNKLSSITDETRLVFI